MTKARDLANIISGGFTADDIPNIDASKITSGSIASARLGNIDLTNLSATNLTSGTIPDARVSSSAVSQHATSFDDNAIVNDLSTIALRQATNENAIAYNTNSSFVDVFQDGSGIASHTTSARNSNEFVSSVILGSLTVNTNTAIVGGGNAGGINLSASQDGDSNTGVTSTSTANVSGFITADWGSSKVISQIDIGKLRGWGDGRSIKITHSTDNSTFNDLDFTNTTQSVVDFNGSQPALSNFTSSGTADWGALTTNGDDVILRLTGFTSFTARYMRYKFGSADFHDANAGFGEFRSYSQTLSTNATGNFISNIITASSTTKMGAIITYEDTSGTNTLNTDIILQLSADNGSNWSTATLSALPNYSTGIKMAKVNDLAVTAGTQLKYKISFANQSGGSKEARIRGVSLQY